MLYADVAKPASMLPVRIYRKVNDILIYEIFLSTDATGRTAKIALYVDSAAPCDYLADVHAVSNKCISMHVRMFAQNDTDLFVILQDKAKLFTHVAPYADPIMQAVPISSWPLSTLFKDKQVIMPLSSLISALSKRMHPTSSYTEVEKEVFQWLDRPDKQQDSTIELLAQTQTPISFCLYPRLITNILKALTVYVKQYQPQINLSIHPAKPYPQRTQQQYDQLAKEYSMLPSILTEGAWDRACDIFCAYWHLPLPCNHTLLYAQCICELLYLYDMPIAPQLPLFSSLPLTMKPREIQYLQECLNKLHAYYPSIPLCLVNGCLHKDTKAAIKNYQRLLGFDVNGELDKKQWLLLQQMCKELQQYEQTTS